MPFLQRSSLSLTERCSIVDRCDALLLVSQQYLDDNRLDSGIVQPRRKCAAQIVQPPRRDLQAGVGELCIEPRLTLAPSGEALSVCNWSM